MKNTILFILVVLQMSLTSQNIIPIPVDSTSVWRVHRQHNDEWCVYHYNSIYYINGTEWKNGYEYFKIYEEGYYYETPVNYEDPCNASYNYSGVYRGGIRTENGKTYGYEQYISPMLLMDFTLNVGDTLNTQISDHYIINSIDSVLVGNEYRKKFNMSNNWNSTWMIEGVGHKGGLFESMDPFESGSTLICYGENYVPIFGNLNCDITVGVNNDKYENQNIQIYPNPTSGSLTIKLTNFERGMNTCILSDVLGRVIFSEKIGSANMTDYEIHFENCEPGIYLLNIVLTNGETINKKIIKK